jgi:hypothetical protein
MAVFLCHFFVQHKVLQPCCYSNTQPQGDLHASENTKIAKQAAKQLKNLKN